MTRPAAPAPTVWLDVVVAVVFAGLSQLELWVLTDAAGPPEQRPLASVILVVVASTLALRSRAPVPAFFVNGGAIAVLSVLGLPGETYPFSNLILLYSMAVVAPGITAVAGLLVGLLGVGFYFSSFEKPAAFAGFTAALWALAWAGGRATRARQTREGLERDRDLSVAIAEARDARLVLETERRDMAREIHDLVGHTVNVMVLHAGAGRRAIPTDLTGARQSLETIERVGRDALDELDGLLRVLSAGRTGPRMPLPGISEITTLAESLRQGGIDVSLKLDPALVVGEAASATVYRVVQEALTNTLRHADAGAASVVVESDGADVCVRIEDDGGGATADTGHDSPDTGRGLRGMEERVALLGGHVEHGDRAEGGFRISARFPSGATT